jgi:hypothetical protein
MNEYDISSTIINKILNRLNKKILVGKILSLKNKDKAYINIHIPKTNEKNNKIESILETNIMYSLSTSYDKPRV